MEAVLALECIDLSIAINIVQKSEQIYFHLHLKKNKMKFKNFKLRHQPNILIYNKIGSHLSVY